jgi:signal peptidase I
VLKRALAVLGIGAAVVVVCAAAAYAVGHRHHKRERVPSESMEPTIKVGQVVSLNTAAYDDHPPAIGDIVIFNPPTGAEDGTCGGGQPPKGQMCDRPTGRRENVLFIKRIVAGPGDRVAIRDGHVIRNGHAVAERYAAPCGGGEGCDFPRTVVVPAGDYVVLGDNRGSSDDSRFWGPVPRGWIVGRVERCDVFDFHCSPRR